MIILSLWRRRYSGGRATEKKKEQFRDAEVDGGDAAAVSSLREASATGARSKTAYIAARDVFFFFFCQRRKHLTSKKKSSSQMNNSM